MIDNRKIAEITGVWRGTCPCRLSANPGHLYSLAKSEWIVCKHHGFIPDFLHDADAFVEVLDWFFKREGDLNWRKDILLAVQQLGDSDAS